MAYDKVVDSAKLDEAMTATADAIRAKSGKTSTFYWNASTGFSNAVNQIDAIVDPICEFRYPVQQPYPEAMILHGYKEIPQGFGDPISDMLKSSYIRRIDFSSSPNCSRILSEAFWDFESCEEIYLPEGLVEIRSDAFSGFRSLETLVLPGGILRLGPNAFEGLTNLKYLEVDAAGLDAHGAFIGCPSLEKVWIRGNCQIIAGRPFASLPNNITIYAEAANRPGGWRDGFDTTFGGQATVIYGQSVRPW